MKRLLSKLAAGSAASVLAVAGFAGIAGASPLTTEGPNSPVSSFSANFRYTSVWNNNNLNAHNSNYQQARSGKVFVANNTTTNNATSGTASNNANFSASVSLNNSGSSAAALAAGSGGGVSTPTANTEGPNSPIRVKALNAQITTVRNNNNINVTNNVSQSAKSGDAVAVNNTTVGSVSSGNATNTSSSNIVLNVSN